MDKEELSEAWRIDQLDPDNWFRIPEFGVNPQDVKFEGFAFPIVTPNTKGYWLRRIIREHIKTVRTLIRKENRSLSEVRASHDEFLEMMMRKFESEKIGANRDQAMATLYTLVMHSAERANANSYGKNWQGTGPQNLDRCLEAISQCAELARNLTLLSLNSKTDMFDIAALSESLTRTIRSNIGKSGASAKRANDPKQADKALVKACWDAWQRNPDDYSSKAAFARDMREQFPNLKSQPVIEGWCRAWERET